MATGSSSAAPDSPPTPVSARRLPAPSFESLRDREFRLYCLGTALVFFDQGMANVALAWLMLELTESAAWVSIAVAVRGLPTVLLTVPAGILADRSDRRRLLILSQSVAALGAVAFAALVWRGLARSGDARAGARLCPAARFEHRRRHPHPPGRDPDARSAGPAAQRRRHGRDGAHELAASGRRWPVC